MSKQKGNGGEREVAGLLAPWWHEKVLLDGEPVRFVRTPMSGGWAYGASFKASGDIMTNAPSFPFSVEVKRNEGWSLKVLLDGKPSPVWAFWRQCQHDAEKTGAEPMLWMRQNRRPWFVMMRKRYVTSLKLPAPDVVWPDRLRLQVDCQAVPVAYLSSNLLALKPQVFVGMQL